MNFPVEDETSSSHNVNNVVGSSNGSPMYSPSMGRVAGEEALRHSMDFDSNSRLAKHFQSQRKRNITQLRWSDLEIGKLLGEGNFSHVYEVRLIFREDLPDTDTIATGSNTIQEDVWNNSSIDWTNPSVDINDDADIWDLVSVTGDVDSDSQAEDEESMGPRERKVRERVYALKHLHPQVTKKQKNFTASAIDLVLEAKLLSCLDHPNIVKLFGVTEGSINRVFSTHGYFLLLDRLHQTLEDKIAEWTAMEQALAIMTSTPTSSSQRKITYKDRRPSFSARKSETFVAGEGELFEKERHKMLSERIGSVAIDIARGMEYLHLHRIIFRDLKPSNVGFTKSNRVKIFDFGLAREIVDSKRKLTGNTGSLRYMAPEVNRREHYGLPADVYSFGIMLWEIAVCHKPFKGMTVDQHADLVVSQGFRPKISVVPGSHELKNLIQKCWSSQPEERPTFTAIRLGLANEVEAHRRLEELEEIRRQQSVAPKTGALRMRMMRQRRPVIRSSYSKSEAGGFFAKVPFS